MATLPAGRPPKQKVTLHERTRDSGGDVSVAQKRMHDRAGKRCLRGEIEDDRVPGDVAVSPLVGGGNLMLPASQVVGA